jgi:lysozyme family protein
MLYSPKFIYALYFLLSWEGGLADDADDRGGRTRYGISSKSHPGVDLDQLTLAGAIAIYHRDYWIPVRAEELPLPLAVATFGAAAHHGPHRSVVLLQQTLGVTADGRVGPQTVAAAHSADPLDTLDALLARRAQFMHDIVVADSRQAKFLGGWLRRLFALHRYGVAALAIQGVAP